MSVNIFSDPLFTATEVSRFLQIPQATVYYWLSRRGDEASRPVLVHSIPQAKKGQASVPFAGLVEAYVLRSLRELRFTKRQILDTVADVRQEFGTDYALANRRIATDGIDIFVEHADGSLTRVGDHQKPIKEVVADYLRYITWDDDSDFASRLRLPGFPDNAKVIIDPRFGWGVPVVERNRVPVSAVVNLWTAGEDLATVADEYDMDVREVESICRVVSRAS